MDPRGIPDPSELTGRALARERLQTAAGGIVAASVAMPLVLRLWSPQWFWIGWLISYLGVSLVATTWLAMRPRQLIHELWAMAVGALFAAVNVSAVVWADTNENAIWMAATASIAYMAFEVAVLPYLNIERWYLGVLIVAASLVVASLLVVHPAIALSLIPLCGAMLMAASRSRQLKNSLTERLERSDVMVHSDPLTGLHNRRGIVSRLAELEGQTVTMALFDADRFKLINDTNGYAVGDAVLIEIARVLVKRLSGDWTLGRQGGDEFVAIAAGATELPRDAVNPISTVISSEERRVPITISLSAGTVTGTVERGGDRLLSEAGFALRHAKRSSDRVAHSNGALRRRFERSLELANLGQSSPFVPLAQIIVGPNQIVGCEILARFRQVDGSVLAPDEFMDVLAENGLLGRLDETMLDHGIRFAARFNDLRDPPFVSINQTASKFWDPELVNEVAALLAHHGVEPARLMLEITESERLGSDDRWEQTALDLRTLGVRLAIDDFGAGYSSIERLKPDLISCLKFDRTVVRAVDGPIGEILKGVTRFCAASDIAVIAEGIETEAELLAIRKTEVSTYQGFLFGRPSSLDDVARRIRDSRRAPDTSANGQPYAAIKDHHR